MAAQRGAPKNIIRNHVVRRLYEDQIADEAHGWRIEAGVDNFDYFNIVDFFKNVLAKRHRDGPLELRLFDDTLNEADPAFVTFRPRILHAHEEVWEMAKLGGDREREIVAHEIGHLVFHDHTAKAFSDLEESSLRSVMKEEQAEWQAITFADHFLLPDHVVDRAGSAERLAEIARVPLDLARRRFVSVRRNKLARRYLGDPCAQCSSLSLVREHGRTLCMFCGERS